MSTISTGVFPIYRPRRLRANPILRSMVRETTLSPQNFVLPLFVRPGKNIRIPVGSMPGVFQLSPDQALVESKQAYEAGVPAIILFGIPDKKDAIASGAFAKNGIVQTTIKLIKKELPDLVVITDVCLCEYMEHGHCGVIHTHANGSVIKNDPTLGILAKTAVSHVEAGADIVAPSDMMDGRVSAIRSALDKRGFHDIPIMSYAAKYSSGFYGPFRDAAESAPKFGDRKTYQMDAANAKEALREVAMDIQEGADIVMVKPALAYLDILYRVKAEFGYPTAAYAVSGEYSMIKAAAANGWIDEKAVMIETHLAMKRAGADLILTYAAVAMAKWLK